MVRRSVHVTRARAPRYDVDGATAVPVGARLDTRANHLQIGPYARKNRSSGARFHVLENDVVEWVALPLSQTQQRLMGLLPTVDKQTLLLFSFVPSWHEPGSKIALFRPVVLDPIHLLLVWIRLHAECFQKAHDG